MNISFHYVLMYVYNLYKLPYKKFPIYLISSFIILDNLLIPPSSKDLTLSNLFSFSNACPPTIIGILNFFRFLTSLSQDLRCYFNVIEIKIKSGFVSLILAIIELDGAEGDKLITLYPFNER